MFSITESAARLLWLPQAKMTCVCDLLCCSLKPN